jgi:hypothetical protein
MFSFPGFDRSERAEFPKPLGENSERASEHQDGTGQEVERYAGEARDGAGLATRNFMDAGLKVIVSFCYIVLWLYFQ